MSYLAEWKAISGRIEGLIQAAKLHGQLLKVVSSDTYGGGRNLLSQTESIFNKLQVYATQFSESLPQLAKNTLDRFIQKNKSLFAQSDIDSVDKFERLKATLVILKAFESEFSFLIADNQAFVRRRSELAFVHLQRCIAADTEVRNKWKHAFQKGEVACEKLGALHLLLHGIWAFKVNAEGERTDLVFNEPLDPIVIQRSAEGLVLTEWKLTRDPQKVLQKFGEAREQAKRYSSGALAGIELTNYRFAIVVTERLEQSKTPNDETDGDLTYRHINLAIDPKTPSEG